jgi:NhaP-type Na+/H+ or K+/H+ antiporter
MIIIFIAISFDMFIVVSVLDTRLRLDNAITYLLRVFYFISQQNHLFTLQTYNITELLLSYSMGTIIHAEGIALKLIWKPRSRRRVILNGYYGQ